tara:strand:+ start:4034 stop:4831 length:798 start_codon:yes stop_codon:yes gene_type:complete
MPRVFRYSSRSYQKLDSNQAHVFAQKHALNIYPADAVYTLIPKNGCSTLRTSIAIANGCIRDAADFNWIHQNNDTFSASLAELAKAKYTFTILRCPYSRLVSVYLDKIVNRNVVAWRYVDLHRRTIDIEDVSFEFFVRSLCRERIRNADIHWRPQTHFLVYEKYDDYFAFENFPQLAAALKSTIDLELVDARPLTEHGTGGYKALSRREPFRLAPFELLGAKNQGRLPTPKSMYNEELVACVKRAYKSDLALYKRLFGAGNLLFN